MKIALPLLSVIAVAAVTWVVTGHPTFEPELRATYTGDALNYRGNKTLLVVVYAPWDPLWKVAEAELAKIDPTEYDLAIVNGEKQPDTLKRLGVELSPMVDGVVVVIRNGEVLKAITNMKSTAQLK